jgi:hypothetical protein
MPRPFPGSPPSLEQLFDRRDLDAAFARATAPDPLGAYPALDKFISDESYHLLYQLIGAGTPVAVAQELARRMRTMGHVSALAMHGAMWRHFLPAGNVESEPGLNGSTDR